jgi:hypothetical protein
VIQTKNLKDFQQELVDLLGRYGVDSFLFETIVFDADKELVDIPAVASVAGYYEKGISDGRMAALLADSMQKVLIRLLMKYSGLTLHQAVGAIQKSVEAGADELEEQQRAFLRGSGVAAEG